MKLLLLIVCLYISLPGHSKAESEYEVLTLVTTNGNAHLFDVELALSDSQKRLGLSGRLKLAPNQGMLFFFETPKIVSMWMKETLMPLDIIFISNNGIVTYIKHSAIPMTESLVKSKVKVQGVLELNAGISLKLGIKPGTKVIHHLFKQ